MRIKISLFIFVIVTSLTLSQVKVIEPGKNHPTSFAIVVDDLTYSKCEEAIKTYKDAIEEDGLSAYVVYSNWKNPDEVKAELLKLYKKNPVLEGAVFVGDIPIAMLRNGQHFTSAFKLDEDRYPWFRSSVPSDRFYEDFDLKFEYLMQDTVHKLSHYYAFLPESPQRIEKDIYSARIKHSGKEIDKYKEISKYLLRVSKQKKEQKLIKNAFVFTGHGYHSQSLPAWADERLSLREQFPQLFKAGGRIKNLNFQMSDEMKETLLLELQQDELDFALFHAHGDTDMQLILAYPVAKSVGQNIEAVKLYLRSKLRTAKRRNQSLEETKAYFIKELNIPENWFDGTFEDSLVIADSVLTYKLDIYIDDVRKIKPQAKFMMFDQCFNGSFHLEEYIAGEYVFGNGNVVVGEANSVNCLQDKWADEMLGLLNLGVRVGLRHKEVNILESHLIGDPTFRFGTENKLDLNRKMVIEKNNIELWKSLLNSEDDEVRSLAVRYLYKNLKDKYEKELVDHYMNDPAINVRMNAIKYLAELNTSAFHNVLKTSVNNSYEFIRRKSAEWMGEVALEEFLPYLVKVVMTDESPRVVFNGRSALTFISSLKANEETMKYIDAMPEVTSKELYKKQATGSFNRSDEWLNKEIIPNILSDTLKLKSKLSEIRTFRNYKFSEALPFLLDQLKNEEQPDSVRRYIAEALGWFSFHHNRSVIIDALEQVIKASNTAVEVRNEAIRTKNRILVGQNDVTLP
jgi:HEAT repeat protein